MKKKSGGRGFVPQHEYKHVEPTWTNDTESNGSVAFFRALSVFPSKKKKKSGVGGLWNMLTQANERAGKGGGEVQTDE